MSTTEELDKDTALVRDLEIVIQYLLECGAGERFRYIDGKLYQKAYKTTDTADVELTVPEQVVDFSGWL